MTKSEPIMSHRVCLQEFSADASGFANVSLITGGIVGCIGAQRPDLIVSAERSHSAAAGVGRLVWVGAVAALLMVPVFVLLLAAYLPGKIKAAFLRKIW